MENSFKENFDNELKKINNSVKKTNKIVYLLKNQYEQKQFDEITTWKNTNPSVISKVMGSIFKPMTWLIQAVIPESAMLGAIQSCNSASKLLIDNENFKKECNISDIKDLKNKSLNYCDNLADEVHNWGITYATTEGGMAGAAGIIGIAIDIPAIITLAFRTINKIGMCYGFECKTEEDNQMILSILSVAGANTIQEKQIALLTIKQLEVIIIKNTWKNIAQKGTANQLSKEAGIITLKKLAKQLGINLTKRKSLQAIPFIGAAVGASVNGVFIRDIGWSARRVFQERWIKEKYKDDLIYDEFENIK